MSGWRQGAGWSQSWGMGLFMGVGGATAKKQAEPGQFKCPGRECKPALTFDLVSHERVRGHMVCQACGGSLDGADRVKCPSATRKGLGNMYF